jgi:peptidyl-prolyl cis-trans isomerase A (cyclophilin A)
MKYLSLIVGLIMLLSCNSKKNPHIQISTNFGNIEAELYPEKAPKTVAAFLSYVDSGLYKNSSFYRVLVEEAMSTKDNAGLIQGGIWQSNNKKALSIPGIVHESPAQTGLSHTTGTLSLARTTAGSASTEFFICIGDKTEFDSSKAVNPDGLGFAAFGRVVNGMTIVREIQNQPANGESFSTPIVILNIERL